MNYEDESLPMQTRRDILLGVFQARKESFLNSLKVILTKMTSELYIPQLFQRPESAHYIPDRVTEVVGYYLNNEREAYIAKLEKKIAAFTQALGEPIMNEIEKIGNKILDLFSRPIGPDEANMIRKYRYRIVQLLSKPSEVKKFLNRGLENLDDFDPTEHYVIEKLDDVLIDTNPEEATRFVETFPAVNEQKMKMKEDAKTFRSMRDKMLKVVKQNEILKRNLKMLQDQQAEMKVVVENVEVLKENFQLFKDKQEEKSAKAKQELEQELLSVTEESKSQIQKLEEEHKKLMDEKNELIIARQKIEMESKMMKQDYEKLQKANEELQNHIAISEEKLQKMSFEKDPSKSFSIEKLEEIKDKKEEEKLELKERLEREINNQKNLISDLEARNKTLLNEIGLCKKAEEKAERLIHDKNNEIMKLTAELSVLDKLNDEVFAATSELNDVKRFRDEIKRERDEAVSTKENLNENLLNTKNQLFKIQSDSILQDSHKFQVMHSEAEKLSLENEELSKGNDKLKFEYDLMTKQNSVLKQRVNDLESQNANLREEINSHITSLRVN